MYALESRILCYFYFNISGRPQHGFARNSKDWKVHHEPKVDVNSGDVELVLELKDTDETQKMWEKKFTLIYKIILKEKSIDLKINVKNEGEDEFDLTFCFHTYFTTSDLSSVGVTDLKGMYLVTYMIIAASI